jgi:hypothetical protein
MTRVSLKEAYDNKDVVAQIYAIRDTAESAVDTSEQAVTTANTASDHVDALVPQVEGAVANANSASASAQASAQTVAGYENRLATVESDLNAVTLRVQTAEGQIVTIQGRVTAIEGNYLKKSGDPQTVVSRIDVPTTVTGVRDAQIANGTRIQNDLDAYAPMVRIANNQTITGLKKFMSNVESHKSGNSNPCFTAIRDDAPDLQTPRYILAYSVNTANGDWVTQLEARINSDGTTSLWAFVRNSDGTPKYVELAKGNVI